MILARPRKWSCKRIVLLQSCTSNELPSTRLASPLDGLEPSNSPNFPMWDRIRIRPQAAAFLSCLSLRVGEFDGHIVPHVAPGEAVADHFQVDEAVAEIDSPDLAAVSVDVHDLDADGLAEHFGGQVLSGFCPKRLALLGASIPWRRILCWTLPSSKMVSVSPSAIATTLPVMVLGS